MTFSAAEVSVVEQAAIFWRRTQRPRHSGVWWPCFVAIQPLLEGTFGFAECKAVTLKPATATSIFVVSDFRAWQMFLWIFVLFNLIPSDFYIEAKNGNWDWIITGDIALQNYKLFYYAGSLAVFICCVCASVRERKGGGGKKEAHWVLALNPMLVMVVGIVWCQLVFGANTQRAWCVFVCVREVSGVRGG